MSVQGQPVERKGKFLENHGVLLGARPLAGIAARAVVVLDAHDKVLHRGLIGTDSDATGQV